MLSDSLTDAKILIVDDQETNLDVLNAMLRREGYTRLHMTLDSSQVLALAADFQPDLILLDLHMPPPDGFELLETLRRRQSPQDYRPIIALTVDASLETRRRALANGVSDFLAKPLDVVETLLRIRNLLHTLRAAEARYRDIFEQAVEGIFQTAPEGRFVTANRALAHMLGFASVEDLLAASSTDFYLDLADRAAFVRQMETRGQVQDFEFRARRRDGAALWLSENSRAARNAQGQLVCYEGFVQDITLRRQAEEALRASEARYRAVTQSANDAIITINSAGAVVGWNPGAEKLFGYTESEMEGQPATQLLPPRHRDGHLAGLGRVRAGGEQHVIGKVVELEGLRKDGREFPLELSLAEWGSADSRFYTGIVRDITERRQAEADLRQRLIETEAVAQISRALRHAQTEEQLLSLFFDELLRLSEAPAGGLWMYDQEANQFAPGLRRGWVAALDLDDLQKNEGLLGRVYQTGEAYLTPDLKSDPLAAPQMYPLVSPGWQAAFLPLRTVQDSFGVIFIATPPPRQISETDLRLLKRLIEIGGNALQRIRLHVHLEHSLQALQSEISVRREIEALLAKEKELLSLSLPSIGEGIISTDPGGVITLFNPAAAAITGYTADEALGQPIERILRLLDQQTHQVVDDPLAYLTQAIAAAAGLDKKTQGLTQIAGVLHDIGKLLQLDIPGFSRAVKFVKGKVELASEYRAYGAAHAELGAYLLGLWGLPQPVIEAAAYHHFPANLASTSFGIVSVLHIANGLYHRERDADPSAGFEAYLDMDYVQKHQLAPSLNAWEDLTQRMLQNSGIR